MVDGVEYDPVVVDGTSIGAEDLVVAGTVDPVDPAVYPERTAYRLVGVDPVDAFAMRDRHGNLLILLREDLRFGGGPPELCAYWLTPAGPCRPPAPDPSDAGPS